MFYLSLLLFWDIQVLWKDGRSWTARHKYYVTYCIYFLAQSLNISNIHNFHFQRFCQYTKSVKET
jgi:hypothetical protein